MQQKENFAFQGILTVQKERFDVVKWLKDPAKRELGFLGDIECIEKFDLRKWIKHEAKKELHFLGDVDSIERKV